MSAPTNDSLTVTRYCLEGFVERATHNQAVAHRVNNLGKLLTLTAEEGNYSRNEILVACAKYVADELGRGDAS